MNDPDIHEELRAVLRHFIAAHEAHEDARKAHDTIATQVADLRRAYMDEIHSDPQGKVKYSNQERRDAEGQRRLELHWNVLLSREERAKQAKLEAAAEAERSLEALKTYRALAGLTEADRRLEAVTLDVASMPRMIRR